MRRGRGETERAVSSAILRAPGYSIRSAPAGQTAGGRVRTNADMTYTSQSGPESGSLYVQYRDTSLIRNAQPLRTTIDP